MGTTNAWPKSTALKLSSSTVARTSSLSSVSMRPKLKKNEAFLRDDWTTDIHVVLANLKRRALAGIDCKRVARVETLVVEIQRSAATKFVSAGSSQNVDSRGWLIVFSCEWILIDANLANRIFRRQIAAGEAVDKDLSAVWSN